MSFYRNGSPQLKATDFPTGPGEKERELRQLIFFKTIFQRPDLREDDCMPHSERSKSLHSEDSDALNVQWKMEQVGLKGLWRYQNGQLMCIHDLCYTATLHSTWDIELQE